MAKYNNFEIEKMLDSMTILVDTREQPTDRYKRRVESFGFPHERTCLVYGDYSAKYIDIENEPVSLYRKVVIERKMAADELCQCFTHDRKRFEREMERCKADNAKMYLLIENENWERLFNGAYKSKLTPEALIGSMLAWQVRYNLNIQFCKAETTGKLIAKILRYELKELLMNEP